MGMRCEGFEEYLFPAWDFLVMRAAAAMMVVVIMMMALVIVGFKGTATRYGYEIVGFRFGKCRIREESSMGASSIKFEARLRGKAGVVYVCLKKASVQCLTRQITL
jgi:hypothetical protein